MPIRLPRAGGTEDAVRRTHQAKITSPTLAAPERSEPAARSSHVQTIKHPANSSRNKDEIKEKMIRSISRAKIGLQDSNG